MTKSQSQPGITQLLLAWSDGDQTALEKLTPLVYAELHRLAKGYMVRELSGSMLQTTALIHEAYIRLIDWKNARWQNRAHFFGVAAQIMRRILVDFARSRQSAKRGNGVQHLSLGDAITIRNDRSQDFIALDDALKSLAKIDLRKSQIVEMKFFGGMNAEETAEVLKVSLRTVEREWNLARAWLYRELRGKDGS
ncbi:MAG: sigma-70 family RNA polymerase sigma factor [Blastocatellia bacterium]|nr:sigma-70 family RNA polymerase sigma factor [Blastocatellia bacterium]